MDPRIRLTVLSAIVSTVVAHHAYAADLAAGQRVYNETCTVCHGPSGKGAVAGTPDFRRPDGVLSQPDSVLLDRILHGYRSAGSPMSMPPKGGNPGLTEQDLENVLAYLHQTFGVQSGSASPDGTSQPSTGNGRESGPMGHGGMGMGHGAMGNRMHGGGMMGR